MPNREVIEQLKKEIGNARLMAVSKTRTIEEVMEAYNMGLRLFGENHVQEIVAKFSTGKPSDMEVHMIGHLQSNKVSKVVGLVDMIESVDSFGLLEKINNACVKINKVMPVLLELNTSGEEAKSGFATEAELLDCIEKAKTLSNVKIEGLMTVGPVACPPEKKDELTRKSFKQLKNLYDGLNLKVLSMGMSGDYNIAVQEGSTQVRIGTKIFGERIYV